MKKLAFIIALLIMATMLFTACDDSSDGGNEDVTTPTADTTPAETTPAETTPAETTPAETERTLASKEGCDYVIMRSEYGDDMLTTASVDIKNALVEKFGKAATPALKTDWEKGVGRDDHIETDTYEILIGDTNRVESEMALKDLPDNHYVIKWIDKKLVIVGSDDYATKNAVAAFIDQCIDPVQGDALVLPLDLNITGQASIQKIELAEGSEIRVMTFNILGSSDGYDDGRKEKIMQTILDYLPDVVGFQESNKTNLSTLHSSATIKKYYSINKNYHSNGSTANYTPILYLKSKYKQVEGGVEWNNSRYTGTNTKSMSWTVLERLSDGQQFIVVNIHGSLWSTNYKLPEGETHSSMSSKAGYEWKLDNAAQILAKVAELQDKYGKLPVFTTGDYNFNRTHAAYTKMQSTGLVSAQDTAKSATTSHASYHNDVGTHPKAGGLAIDHIFYSPESLEAVKHVICMRELDINASDHCPVYTDFAFKK